MRGGKGKKGDRDGYRNENLKLKKWILVSGFFKNQIDGKLVWVDGSCMSEGRGGGMKGRCEGHGDEGMREMRK